MLTDKYRYEDPQRPRITSQYHFIGHCQMRQPRIAAPEWTESYGFRIVVNFYRRRSFNDRTAIIELV